MTHGTAQDPGPSPQAAGEAEPDFASLGQDWITLWQSELAAIATDREMRETWHLMLSVWAGAAALMWQATTLRPKADARTPPPGGTATTASPVGSARAADAPGTAPSAAAPDAGMDEIERLRRRVAQLEQRLATVEARPGPVVRRPRPRAKPPRA